MVSQTIQAERIKSGLTTTEFSARGERSTFVVLFAGNGTYFSDEVARDVAGPCLIWAPTGWATRLTLAAGTRGFLIRMPERALGRALPTDLNAANVRSLVSQRIFFSDLPKGTMQGLAALFEKIETELREIAPGTEAVLHHCVSLLLIEVWRAAAPQLQSAQPQPHSISDSFLNLVELHLQNHWTVGEYAQRIGVSRDRLNDAVRRGIGISPHQHIQGRLIEEAKALLVSSNLQVAEVAYKLGFSDAAYFSRVFQRHEKMPPGKFRRTYTPLYRRSTADISFANWP